MATKKISKWEQIIKRDSTSDLKEMAQNKYKMYAVNVQKAAKNILAKRKKR